MSFLLLLFCLPRDEVTLTRKIGYLRYFYSAAYFFSAILVVISAIVPHALSKGIILRRIFTTASYCVVMRMTLTRQLPGSIQMWYDTLALIKKIEVGAGRCAKSERRLGESGPTTFLLTCRSSCWRRSTGRWSTTWPPPKWSCSTCLRPGTRWARGNK